MPSVAKSMSRIVGVIGAFFLLTAFATIPILDSISGWFWFWLSGAIVSFGFFLRFHFKAVKDRVGSRQALMVLNLVLLTALFLGILVIANLISQKRAFRVDLTENKFFSLSEGTIEFTKRISEEVTVTCFIPESYNVGNVSLFRYVEQKLNLMSMINPRLNYRLFDPSTVPLEKKLYGLDEYFKENPNGAAIVFEQGLKHKGEEPDKDRITLYQQDLFSTNFSRKHVSNKVKTLMIEPAIQTGINYLQGERKIVVCQRVPNGRIVSGKIFGALNYGNVEKDSEDEERLNKARQVLKSSGIRVYAQSRIMWNENAQVPDVILLSGLTEPLSSVEIINIRKMVERGAGLVVFQSLNLQGAFYGDVFLETHDILDWSKLFEVLKKGIRADKTSPIGRICSLMGGDLKKEILSIPPDEKPGRALKQRIVLGLNKLLIRTDFFDKDVFKIEEPCFELKDMERSILGADKSKINKRLLVFFHRLVIENLFPDLVQKSKSIMISINELLAPYSVELERVRTQDKGQCLGDPGTPLIMVASEHPSRKWMGEAFFPQATHVVNLKEPGKGVIFATSKGASLKFPDGTEKKNLPPASFGICEEIDRGFDKSSRVVVVGSDEFYVSEKVIAEGEIRKAWAGNFQFMVSSIEWAAHKSRDYLSSGLKDEIIEQPVLGNKSTEKTLLYIFVIVYPLIFIAIGFMVWAKRAR